MEQQISKLEELFNPALAKQKLSTAEWDKYYALHTATIEDFLSGYMWPAMRLGYLSEQENVEWRQMSCHPTDKELWKNVQFMFACFVALAEGESL